MSFLNWPWLPPHPFERLRQNSLNLAGSSVAGYSMTVKSIFLILLAASSLAVAQAEVQIHGTPTELAATLQGLPQLATIHGSAEIKTNANRARVDLLVTTEDRSLESALTDNARQRDQLVRVLGSRGIQAGQIQNSEFASSQRHALFSDKVKSYRIENHVIVTVHNGEQLRSVAREIDSQPVATLQGIEFDHSEETAIQRLAVEQALADASAQKSIYERALDVRLTARKFSEGSAIPYSGLPNRFFGGGGGGISAQTGSAPGSSGDFSPNSIPDKPAFVFGQLIFKAAVTVQYAVEGNK